MGGFNFPRAMQRGVRHEITISKAELQKATDKIAIGDKEATFDAGNYFGIMQPHPLSWVKANRVTIVEKDYGIEVAQFFTKKRKVNRNKWGAQNAKYNYWCEIV